MTHGEPTLPTNQEQLTQVHDLHKAEIGLDPSNEIYSSEKLGIPSTSADGKYSVGVMAEVHIPLKTGEMGDLAVLAITRNADGEKRYVLQGLEKDKEGNFVSNGRQNVQIQEKGTVLGRNGDGNARLDNEVPSSLLWGVNKKYGSQTSRSHVSFKIEKTKKGESLLISDTSSNGTEVVAPASENRTETHESIHSVGVRERAGELAVKEQVAVAPEIPEATHEEISAAKEAMSHLAASGRERLASKIIGDLLRKGDIDEAIIGSTFREMSSIIDRMTEGGRQFAGFETVAYHMSEIAKKESSARNFSGQIRTASPEVVRGLVAQAVELAGESLQTHRQWHEEKRNASGSNPDAVGIQSVFNSAEWAAMNNVSNVGYLTMPEYIARKLPA